MDIDPDVLYWILDFLLRQPLEDRTLGNLLLTLPIPDDKPNLKISLLLHKLQSHITHDSIPESALEILEQLEEILARRGTGEVLEAMKCAYCAVAVEATVMHLKNESYGESDRKFKFFEAVRRVWKGRIGRMEKLVQNGGLGSNELWAWGDEMEAAVWEDGVCDRVVKKSELINATKAVGVYLREEWERLGPSFLQVLADRLKTDVVLKEVLGLGNGDGDARMLENSFSADGIMDAPKHSHSHELRKENFQSRSKLASFNHSRGVKITDSDETTTHSSHSNCKFQPSTEVDRVQDALESRSLGHQEVVENPVCDALQLSETVTELAGKGENLDNVEVKHVEARAVQGNGSTANNVDRPNLMERNSTARTSEWSESIDGSTENSADESERLKLPSPRHTRDSPLKRCLLRNSTNRRKFRKWSLLEEDALRTGVEKYGRGKWKAILTVYSDIFEDRTEVDLKDKWRNLTRD